LFFQRIKSQKVKPIINIAENRRLESHNASGSYLESANLKCAFFRSLGAETLCITSFHRLDPLLDQTIRLSLARVVCTDPPDRLIDTTAVTRFSSPEVEVFPEFRSDRVIGLHVSPFVAHPLPSLFGPF
jgi:hypothetical protein